MNDSELIKTFLHDPTSMIDFEYAQHHENVVIIPIFYTKKLDFVTVRQAQEQGDVEINETNSVGKLKIDNKGSVPVLIPFGVTVKGGKQDRTVYEPILVPTINDQEIDITKNPIPTPMHVTPLEEIVPQIEIERLREHFSGTSRQGRAYKKQDQSIMMDIPTRCVELSRWSMAGSTKQFKVASRISPMVSYQARSSHGQDAVWSSIQSLKSTMNLSAKAPTSNYNDIVKAKKKDIDEFLPHFRLMENQCGVIVFVDNDMIAIEFYGNPRAWEDMHVESIKAFILEAMISEKKDIERLPLSDFRLKAIETLTKIHASFTTHQGRGLGNVVDITATEQKWRGVSLVHEDTIVQLYLVKENPRSKTFSTSRNGIVQRIQNPHVLSGMKPMGRPIGPITYKTTRGSYTPIYTHRVGSSSCDHQYTIPIDRYGDHYDHMKELDEKHDEHYNARSQWDIYKRD